jgi:hypothetical protein
MRSHKNQFDDPGDRMTPAMCYVHYAIRSYVRHLCTHRVRPVIEFSVHAPHETMDSRTTYHNQRKLIVCIITQIFTVLWLRSIFYMV